MVAEREDSLIRGVLGGVAAFRGLAWGWMAIILAFGRPELDQDRARPWVAYTMAGVALAATLVLSSLLRNDTRRLTTLPMIAMEIAVGFALGVGDQLAYNGVNHPQWLASSWPLAGIFSAGIAFGASGGVLAGCVVGLGRLVGFYLDPDFWWSDADDVISVTSTLVLYAIAGWTAGYVFVRLREAERRLSLAQAREEIARTLHDGVLQTLAMVQRRATDPDVARLAHDQERELREYLFGSPTTVDSGGELGTRLRIAAARFEDHHGGAAQVVLAPDMPALPPGTADALVGAVTEALTNAGKHGGAHSVTVFAEPADGEVFCSVKDDGKGFDCAQVVEGVGLGRSIRGRISDIGGRVEVDGRPGRGVEVRCWVPA